MTEPGKLYGVHPSTIRALRSRGLAREAIGAEVGPSVKTVRARA